MRVTSISFRKTKQVARYEPESIEIVVEIAEGESVQNAISAARRTCDIAFGDMPDEVAIAQAQATLARVSAPSFA